MDTRQRAVAEVAVGASVLTVDVARSLARAGLPMLRPVLRPVERAVLRPPFVPAALRPQRLVHALRDRGAAQLPESSRWLAAVLDRAVPVVVEMMVRRLDLTALVVRYVDLDAVVAHVNLDLAVQRVDLDSVASRLDVDAVASRLDVDAVARHLDLEAVLDRLDLTGVVLRRIDLDALIQAVLERIDLAGLVEDVIDEVDLSEIIRESTGAMASDTVRDARMRAIVADHAVARLRDRFRLRRGPNGRPDTVVVPAPPAHG